MKNNNSLPSFPPSARRPSPGTVAGLLLFCAALGASAADSDGPKAYPGAGLRTVVVATDSGAITLNVAEDKAASAAISPAPAPGDDCVVTRELSAGTLTLGARARARGAKPCSAGFVVSAPPRVAVKARSGSGDVELGAFSGASDVRTGSGAIALHGPSGALTLRTGSGSVTGQVGGQAVDVATGSGEVDLRGLTGSVKARSGSGAVALAWTGAPRTGAIDVRTGSGDLRATLPADARLKISARSGSGGLKSEFDDDESAGLLLTFRSGSGEAIIKKGTAAEAAADGATKRP